MNIVCLNCEKVTGTVDPRQKFCDGICRNRYNVRKSRIKQVILELKRTGKGVSIFPETMKEKEWVDPI